MPTCVESRVATLEATQNADGGWGYFPGKQSQLEPTAYAMLALQEQPGCRAALDRGWRLLRSWQLPDGGWGAGAALPQAHWATSLVVTLYCAAGICDGSFQRAVEWLVASTGAETRLVTRVAHWLDPSTVEFDPGLGGWPWQPGTSSWIEPTAHALMALRRAARWAETPGLASRVAMGERMLLERRCRDGGWNYGNRRVLGADLPSYPETTALALMALDGHAAVRWGMALEQIERQWRETHSPLARAWLAACLLQYRGQRPEPPDPGVAVKPAREPADLLVTAIEAIAWNRILAA
jgi:hypothetical protein